MIKHIASLAAILSFIATPGATHEFKIGDLSIGHPYALVTPSTAKTGAGYMTITNSGSHDDRLIEIRSNFPKTTLHTTRMADGVASMIELDGLEIPKGTTATFEPGGNHVMFMGLSDGGLTDGMKIPATLVFEQAGTVDVEFNVQPRSESDAPMTMDHSTHTN